MARPPATNDEREAARQDAARLRAAQERRDKRNRFIAIGVMVVALLAFIGVVVFILQDSKKPPLEGVSTPTAATENGGILTTTETGVDSSEAVEVGVYLDYMCPICAQFESINGESLDALNETGKIKLVMHPVSILDRFSEGTEYSTRAAAAGAYVADQAPENFVDFNAAMFANQPAEGSTGLTNEQIADIARAANVPEDVAGAIADGTADEAFRDWVEGATELATNDPNVAGERGFGTPTITIDGKRWEGDWRVDGAIEAAVDEIAGTPAE